MWRIGACLRPPSPSRCAEIDSSKYGFVLVEHRQADGSGGSTQTRQCEGCQRPAGSRVLRATTEKHYIMAQSRLVGRVFARRCVNDGIATAAGASSPAARSGIILRSGDSAVSPPIGGSCAGVWSPEPGAWFWLAFSPLLSLASANPFLARASRLPQAGPD
jgi:hypothetical protein